MLYSNAQGKLNSTLSVAVNTDNPYWSLEDCRPSHSHFSEFYEPHGFLPFHNSQLNIHTKSHTNGPDPVHITFVWILSFHQRLGLPIGFLPSSPPTKFQHLPPFSSVGSSCPVHLILNCSTKYNSVRRAVCESLIHPVFSNHLFRCCT